MIDDKLTRRRFHHVALAGALAATARRAAAQAPKPGKLGPGASLEGQRVFPANDLWNTPIDREEVDTLSTMILRRLGLDKPLHPDFGTVYRGAPNGIPYTVVSGDQPKVPVTFRYADESDPGPYPIPPDTPIEGGPNGDGDRHVLIVDRDNNKLYELFSAHPERNGRSWSAGSGAIFDLDKSPARPFGWTSADAAGLPVFPGLVRYDEVVGRGVVNHAFRFTVERSRRAYIPPARHFASPRTDIDLPPMGLRVRLKRGFDIRKFPASARVILLALQTHGMILADNGGDWFLSGAPDPRWDDEELATLKRVKVRDFEVVKMGEMVTR
jgi:hypothetical protein